MSTRSIPSTYSRRRLKRSLRIPSASELLVRAAWSWDRGGKIAVRADAAHQNRVSRYHRRGRWR